jgi:hypothetical protein
METPSSSESVPVSRARVFLVLGGRFFLSGATGLVYQVVWFRMLGLVFGHTVYATTTVLVASWPASALGSLLLARRAHRLRDLEPRNARACYLAGIATARGVAPSRAVPLFERAAALAPGDRAIQRALARYRGWDLVAGSWPGDEEQAIAQSFAR